MHYLSRAAKHLFSGDCHDSARTRCIEAHGSVSDDRAAGVRKQLKLGKGDQIRYCTEPSGRVYIEPVRAEEEDPVLGAFLDFVEADIKAHPDRIRAFDGALHDRLAALVGDVDVDIDAPLSLEDE